MAGLVLAAALARRRWWLTRVRSESMYPTLLPGQLVWTRAVRAGDLRRGDLVVLKSAELGRDVIKRVVGLPGDRVDHPAGTVPAGCYWVLGDNPDRSSDSRSWVRPFVPGAAVRGRVSGRPAGGRRARRSVKLRPSRPTPR